MLRIGVKTKQSSDEVCRGAIQFFGPQGEGLKIADQRDNPPAIRFEGSVGMVEVVVIEKEKGTSVELASSQEWDQQVQDFAREIGGQ
jgi:hypothetical protein